MKQLRSVLALAVVVGSILAGCSSTDRPGAAMGPADLVLRGGRVVTVDEDLPEAQAVAILGSRIVAVGTDAEIAPLDRRSDAGDRARRPAADSRLHRGARPLHGTGRRRAHPRPRDGRAVGRRSWRWWRRPFARRSPVSGSAAAAGIRRSGVERPTPEVEGNPVHAGLSAVSPDNPVILGHASGHASFANARAMELAGIGARHGAAAGRRDRARRRRRAATGLLRETAQRMVRDVLVAARARRSPEAIETEARRRWSWPATRRCATA